MSIGTQTRLVLWPMIGLDEVSHALLASQVGRRINIAQHRGIIGCDQLDLSRPRRKQLPRTLIA